MNDKRRLRKRAIKLADLVHSKGEAYGDTITKAEKIITALYPNGIMPHQYKDILCFVRVIDKMGRLAQSGKYSDEEYPWKDIAGYGLRMIKQEDFE